MNFLTNITHQNARENHKSRNTFSHQEETSFTKVCHERRQTVPAPLEDTPLCYTSGNVFTWLTKELQKVTVIVVICQLRIPHEQLCSHWTDFRKLLYWWLLLNSVYRLKVWLKLDKNIGHLTYYLAAYPLLTNILHRTRPKKQLTKHNMKPIRCDSNGGKLG